MKEQIESRDRTQKSLGWVGFSAIVHVALLVAILFSQMSRRTAANRTHKQPQAGALTLRSTREAKSLNREVVLTESPVQVQVAVPDLPKETKEPKEPKKIVAPIEPPVIVARNSKAKKTRVAHYKKPLPALAASASEPAREKILEPYQPESIPSASQTEASQLPEKLSPVISDGIDTPPQIQGGPEAAATAPAALDAPAADVGAAAVPYAAPAADANWPASEAHSEAAIATKSAGPEVGANQQSGGIVDASLRQPLVGNPLPGYPQADRYAGNQGTAVVTGHVGSDGHVSGVKVERSSGSRTIDQASIAAFQGWKFAPGPEATVRKSFAFYLQGEAKVVKARLGSGS